MYVLKKQKATEKTWCAWRQHEKKNKDNCNKLKAKTAEIQKALDDVKAGGPLSAAKRFYKKGALTSWQERAKKKAIADANHCETWECEVRRKKARQAAQGARFKKIERHEAAKKKCKVRRGHPNHACVKREEAAMKARALKKESKAVKKAIE